MNIIVSLLLALVSYTDVMAQDNPVQSEEVKVDIYLTRAGWAKQDGGYMDPESSVIWGPEIAETSWGEAKTYCENLVYGGRNDWRLPTVNELQRSVCKVTGYSTRISCPEPRNHQKDLWLLNKKMEKGITYWAGDLIPGDPYNAYYFLFDVEGQHVITSKGDKSKARCVTMSKVPLNTETSTKKEDKTETNTSNEDFVFYIAPYVGFGGFFANSVELTNHPFLSGEIRVGFKVSDKMMVFFSGDTGFNIQDRTYPVVSTFSIGPEYFITDDFSIFAGVGLGILTGKRNIIAAIVTETYAGFDWKAGLTWQAIKWGDKGQYALPLSVTYTGVKTSWVLSHTVIGAVGFMYFN